ncbi:hypothetical protein [Roseivirga echinicomitans]|uniref:Uncharacterized protein n=1 Tax=Roseivirga echinicomitans TaxID=296218 RepID=A0A150XVN9_9BACT|nr:hypothetical protein [Roseivirga echinicomitans]KYG82821.1 hypothetical protein AWN68_13625 [Roseivirga echinicomitans]
MKKYIIVLCFALGLNALMSCSAEDDFGFDKNTTLEEAMGMLEEIQSDIQGIVSDKSCDGSGDCKVLAYGKKACGGPSTYVIYGSKIDEALLEKKSNEYTALQDEMNKRYGLISDCSLMYIPEATCVDGKCVIVEL